MSVKNSWGQRKVKTGIESSPENKYKTNKHFCVGYDYLDKSIVGLRGKLV